jgi:hypothetical protein
VLYIPSPVSPSDVPIPQTYIINEKDNAVLLDHQEKIAARGGMKTIRFPQSGHAPFLDFKQELADAISQVACPFVSDRVL